MDGSKVNLQRSDDLKAPAFRRQVLGCRNAISWNGPRHGIASHCAPGELCISPVTSLIFQSTENLENSEAGIEFLSDPLKDALKSRVDEWTGRGNEQYPSWVNF